MKQWESAYQDWLAGLKYREIADKHGVSEGTVKSWVNRYFKLQKERDGKKVAEKVARKVAEKLQPSPKKLQPQKPGAPIGNQNAAGTHEGAPEGNTNRLTHGAYSKAFDTLLTESNRNLLAGMNPGRLAHLRSEIDICTKRELWLLQQINKYEAIASGLAVHGIVKEGEKSTTTALSTFENIKVLNDGLTKVQRTKSMYIRMLFEFVEEEDSGEGREDALEFVGALDSPSNDWEDNDAEAEDEAGADEI